MTKLHVTARFHLHCLAAALACAACSGYSPGGLPLGSSQAQVAAAMGPATAEHPAGAEVPKSVKRLEYARGPLGRHTYMLDFDAQGKLLSWQQVLTEPRFSQVQRGWSEDELRRWLGTPSNVRDVGWRGQKVWSYRFESPFCVWFEVGVEQGKVTEMGQGPDPLCETNDNDMWDL